jgi:hypothetical protein
MILSVVDTHIEALPQCPSHRRPFILSSAWVTDFEQEDFCGRSKAQRSVSLFIATEQMILLLQGNYWCRLLEE